MQRCLVVLSFASGCLLVVLSLATSLLGGFGDAIAHVLIGLFGFVVAWLFALELGLVTFAIARARSFTVSRAASDIAIALIACAVLAPVNGGGLVGVALMDTASPWTRLFVFALGFSFFAIVRRMFRDASTARLTHRVVVERVENAAPVRTRTNNTNDVEHRTLRAQEHHATPSLSLLDEVPDATARVDATDAARLVHALSSFDIDVSIDETCIGPSVVTYEATLAAGIKLSRVLSLEEDLSLACGKRVRVISSGRRVGFELAREQRARVGLRELLAHDSFQPHQMTLPIPLGRDVRGEPLVIDLAAMPHLLVAGATGSGKSAGLNAMLASLLFARTPREMRLLLIDPKQVEFAAYANIPHLLEPVVTDMNDAEGSLTALVDEMERRYALLADARCRNIAAFNEHNAAQMPCIVVVIDEFADLVSSHGKRIEALVLRLAQKGRACGVHLIIATQRPSVRVVNGAIKANVPARLCYRVAQAVDSRVMLDQQGAEHLLGHGDALVQLPGDGALRRVQSPWLRDAEIDALTRRLRGEVVDVRTADRNCQRSTTCSFRPQRLGDRATSGEPSSPVGVPPNATVRITEAMTTTPTGIPMARLVLRRENLRM